MLNGQDFDWRSALRNVDALLTDAGSWCEYGHLSRTKDMWQLWALDADHGDRRIADASRYRDDLAELPTRQLLFDAYGVMRVKAEFARAMSLDPDTWLTQILATGDLLVRHRNAEAWFARPHIDVATLTAARQALVEFTIDRSSERLDATPGR